MTNVKPIPEGMHTLTPHLVIKNAQAAIEFYKKAFEAQEHARMLMPDGKIMHARIQIGDSVVMIADDIWSKSPQTLGDSPVTLHLYVEDVDKVFNQAIQAGANSELAPTEMFWGDRYGVLKDPFGHRWSIATHTRDLSPTEIEKGQNEACAQMANAKC